MKEVNDTLSFKSQVSKPIVVCARGPMSETAFQCYTNGAVDRVLLAPRRLQCTQNLIQQVVAPGRLPVRISFP